MAVKSFIGRRTRARLDLQSVDKKIKVSDYMTRNIVTFHPEQYLVEVIQTLLQKNISGGPVVNDEKDRKSTRLNSSHVRISYAVFCLKKKNKNKKTNLKLRT